MKILKSWIQDHIVEKLPSDDIITSAFILKSSEVEGIEKTKDINGNDDTIFDIKVLPDRAHYMLSHRGVAYDLATILGLTLKSSPLVESASNKTNSLDIKINSNLCRRYNATLVENISVSPSPQWLKYRLEAIEARSINSVVDATNYAMFDSGQPLHAFDADKVVGSITVRFANTGEKMTTLDGKEIIMKDSYLVIADDEGILALAGIKGGKRAEVDMNTKRIILESANFDPVSVRRTSFAVAIRNDSSKRFENEITPHLVTRGSATFLNLLSDLKQDYKIVSNSDVYDSLPDKWSVEVSHKKIESILNFSIEQNKVIDILSKLGCEVTVNDGKYVATPPYERLDLVIGEDLIDEIGRVHGLDKVTSIVPSLSTKHTFAKDFIVTEKIKDILVSCGFNEIQTRSFSNKGEVEVAYPMAVDKAFLRTSLSFNLQESIDLAIKNAPLLGLDEIRIFEIGKVFKREGESLDLCIGMDFAKKVKNKEQIIKIELENVVAKIENALGLKLDGSIPPKSNFYYAHNLDTLLDSIDEQKINADSIENISGSRKTFTPFSVFPFMVRDVAVFVPTSVDSDKVWQVIDSCISKSDARSLLVRHSLFDTFKKDDKISYAFRLIFQSMERTLTDDEINNVMNIVYSELKNSGWEVR